jgi:hypothetical protein
VSILGGCPFIGCSLLHITDLRNDVNHEQSDMRKVGSCMDDAEIEVGYEVPPEGGLKLST